MVLISVIQYCSKCAFIPANISVQQYTWSTKERNTKSSIVICCRWWQRYGFPWYPLSTIITWTNTYVKVSSLNSLLKNWFYGKPKKKRNVFCGTYFRNISCAILNFAVLRYQTVMYPQQYIQQQQQQPNIILPSGRCCFHGIENHKCAFVNHPLQSHHQPHVHTNHINQQGLFFFFEFSNRTND